MTRKKAKVGVIRNWRCKICNKRNFPSKYRLARHIAQMKDDIHKSWRIENNIIPPDTETMRDIPRMVKQIEPLIEDWQLS